MVIQVKLKSEFIKECPVDLKVGPKFDPAKRTLRALRQSADAMTMRQLSETSGSPHSTLTKQIREILAPYLDIQGRRAEGELSMKQKTERGIETRLATERAELEALIARYGGLSIEEIDELLPSRGSQRASHNARCALSVLSALPGQLLSAADIKNKAGLSSQARAISTLVRKRLSTIENDAFHIAEIIVDKRPYFIFLEGLRPPQHVDLQEVPEIKTQIEAIRSGVQNVLVEEIPETGLSDEVLLAVLPDSNNKSRANHRAILKHLSQHSDRCFTARQLHKELDHLGVTYQAVAKIINRKLNDLPTDAFHVDVQRRGTTSFAQFKVGPKPSTDDNTTEGTPQASVLHISETVEELKSGSGLSEETVDFLLPGSRMGNTKKLLTEMSTRPFRIMTATMLNDALQLVSKFSNLNRALHILCELKVSSFRIRSIRRRGRVGFVFIPSANSAEVDIASCIPDFEEELHKALFPANQTPEARERAEERAAARAARKQRKLKEREAQATRELTRGFAARLFEELVQLLFANNKEFNEEMIIDTLEYVYTEIKSVAEHTNEPRTVDLFNYMDARYALAMKKAQSPGPRNIEHVLNFIRDVKDKLMHLGWELDEDPRHTHFWSEARAHRPRTLVKSTATEELVAMAG